MTEKDIINSWNTTDPIIPTKEQIKKYPILEYYEHIIKEALKKDPTIITLLKGANLKDEYIKIIIEQNLIITEEILKENPYLTKKQLLMEYALKETPRLILYADCPIRPTTINEVLKEYRITKKELKQYPNLLKQYTLLENNPELEEYIKYAPPIIELKDALINNEDIENIKLIGDKITVIQELSNILIQDEETNKKEQEEAYRNLMTIIEKIIKTRYKNQKITFEYPDIITLNDVIIKTFQNINDSNIEEAIDELTKKISTFIEGKLKKPKIKKQLLIFYKNYIQKKSLIISETELFCNKILNIHRDNYINKEKNIIIENLKQQLELTQKKKQEIYTRRKLKIITQKIKEGEITNLDHIMYYLRSDFKINKKMKKLGITITEEMYEMLDTIYKQNGTLNNSPINKIVNTENKDVIKYIINKYEKIKLRYLKQIKLTNKKITEEEKNKIALNTKNYIIKNRKYANYQAVTLFISQNKETLEKLLEKKENIKEIIELLPYTNLFKEISTQTIIEIIKTYEYVKNKKLKMCDKKRFIFENLDEIILISSGYYMVTDTIINALTPKVISGLGETHIKKYLDFYLKMLEQQETQIPPIEFEYQDLTLTSGDYDPERLLIGKLSTLKSSCIDLLDIGGKKTYQEALLKEEGDTILIKQKEKLIARILVFRRGNTIQLISHQDQKQHIDLYYKIAQEIKLKSENDNIDCIVVNENSVIEQNIDKMIDHRFIDYFPHADTSDNVIILYKNKKRINFIEEPIRNYKKKRKPVNYSPTKLDILRIESLYIAKTNKKNLPNYEQYNRIITGEDWLLAQNENNIETILINDENKESKNEIEQTKEKIKKR